MFGQTEFYKTHKQKEKSREGKSLLIVAINTAQTPAQVC